MATNLASFCPASRRVGPTDILEPVSPNQRITSMLFITRPAPRCLQFAEMLQDILRPQSVKRGPGGVRTCAAILMGGSGVQMAVIIAAVRTCADS